MVASLLALFACGQAKEEPMMESQLGEFVGIELGESISTATEKMLAKQGVTFLSDSADIVFRGGELLGTPVDEWILSFWRGERFWFLQVHLTVDSASSMLTYESIRMALIAQYGPPTDEDAGRLGGMRSLGWREAVEGSSKDNVLSIMLTPDRRVMVWFAGFGYIDTVEGKSG